MSEPRCETCRWFESNEYDKAIGRCHIRSVGTGEFPGRYAKSWCGEHALPPKPPMKTVS